MSDSAPRTASQPPHSGRKSTMWDHILSRRPSKGKFTTSPQTKPKRTRKSSLVCFLLTTYLILFDSGASHSFISGSFVAQNKFPCSILGKSMMVQSPGSVLRSNLVCRNLDADIKGVRFPTSLIVIESAKLDIILGMNWLTQYQVCTLQKKTLP